MVALIERAEKARAESARLREHARALGEDLRSRREHLEARWSGCLLQYARGRRLRDSGRLAAWSDLPWVPPRDDLDHIVVLRLVKTDG